MTNAVGHLAGQAQRRHWHFERPSAYHLLPAQTDDVFLVETACRVHTSRCTP